MSRFSDAFEREVVHIMVFDPDELLALYCAHNTVTVSTGDKGVPADAVVHSIKTMVEKGKEFVLIRFTSKELEKRIAAPMEFRPRFNIPEDDVLDEVKEGLSG